LGYFISGVTSFRKKELIHDLHAPGDGMLTTGLRATRSTLANLEGRPQKMGGVWKRSLKLRKRIERGKTKY